MYLKRIERGWFFNYGIFEAKELEECVWTFECSIYPVRTYFVEPGERVRIRLKKSDGTDLFEVGDEITLYNLMDRSNRDQFHWYEGERS